VAQERPITFTAVIFVGLLLVIAGAIVTIAGIGGVSAFEVTTGSITVKTPSVGLAMMATGAFLSGGVARKLPEGVKVFGPTPPTLEERLYGLGLPLLVVAVATAVAFVLTVVR
jgi:hypothetical protein